MRNLRKIFEKLIESLKHITLEEGDGDQLRPVPGL
jgi:hypothetical protein